MNETNSPTADVVLSPPKNKFKEETGNKYGMLTVMSVSETERKHVRWHCLCDCGKHKIVRGDVLRIGGTKSCGCLKLRRGAESHSHKHGRTKTKIHGVWRSMKERCFNPKCRAWDRYGGRGITVCERWLESINFFSDMETTYKPGHSLERIDNNKGYCLENCRWATLVEQANNKRNNHRITHEGETKTISEWWKITGINKNTIRSRLKLGWSEDDAVSTPLRK